MVIIGPSVGILCPRDIWIHNKLHARIRSLCTYLSFRHIHKQNPTLRNIQAYICIYIGVERLERSNQSHKQNNPLLRHIHMHMCGNSHITYIYKYIHTHIHKHIHTHTHTHTHECFEVLGIRWLTYKHAHSKVPPIWLHTYIYIHTCAHTCVMWPNSYCKAY